MLIYALRPQMLPRIKRAYDSCMLSASAAAKEKMQLIDSELRGSNTATEVYRRAAALYSAQRETPSMFVHFDHASLNLKVMSVEGELGKGDFPADNPVTLMQHALTRRASVHVPDLQGLDKRSLTERVDEGETPSGSAVHLVEMVDNNGEPDAHYHASHFINGLIPRGFSPKGGSLLITPLGIENATKLALGFILEHKEGGPFSIDAIQEARSISTLFTLRIVEGLIREVSGE